MRFVVGTRFERPLVIAMLVMAALGLTGAIYAKHLNDGGRYYSYTTVNDASFYRAMADRLWDKPLPTQQELNLLPPHQDVDEVMKAYETNGDNFHALYLHAENGLSHQPAFAYRILVPEVAAGVHQLGPSLEVSFVLVHMAGVILVALLTYLLMIGSFVWSFRGMLTAGSTLVAVALTSPESYVDGLYFGLMLIAVWAGWKNYRFTFLVAALLAALARETGLVLALFWIVMALRRGERPAKYLPAAAPVVGFLLPHFLVDVPNKSIPYLTIIQDRLTPGILLLAVAMIGVVFLGVPRPQTSETGRDRLLTWSPLIVGVLSALGLIVIATGMNRMAFLMFPLAILPPVWEQIRSKWSSAAWITAMAMFVMCSKSGSFAITESEMLKVWTPSAVIVGVVGWIAWRKERQLAATAAPETPELATLGA